MSDNIKLRLTLDVEYKPNGTPQSELRGMLLAIVDTVLSRGAIAGATPAEVETWHAEVTRPNENHSV